jgi:hypothetical protein
MKLKNMTLYIYIYIYIYINLGEFPKYGLRSRVCNLLNLLNSILGINQEAHFNIEGWNKKNINLKNLPRWKKKETIKIIRRIWYANMIKEDEIIRKQF